MNMHVNLGCASEILVIPVGKILPVKTLAAGAKKSVKYRRIASSVRELGVIEPLAVYPEKTSNGAYVLLDGHVRLEVLKDLGQETAECLVASDDEAFTYNHKVNRLSAIQEHFMILRATRNGVSEERIAKTLNVDVATIRRKRDMLDGICPEAVELLRDKRATAGAIRELRKVKPMRQIEMVELMTASQNFSVVYAKCLYAATPTEHLAESDKPKEVGGLAPEEVSRMEREMDSLSQDFKLIEETHGRNVLNLVLVARYLKKLIDNARVVRYLSQHYPELLAEFQKIAEARSLADGS